MFVQTNFQPTRFFTNADSMTIALFGATGQTGQHVLQQALDAGYRVRALVRDPAKLTRTHPNLTVLTGDVLHADDVRRTVDGTDGVVSVFGHVKGSPAWLQTDGTRHITEAMQAAGVRKIVSLSGGGLPYEKDQPKFADYLIRGIMRVFVPKVLDDAKRHADVLRQSGLDWVIVRGPRLTNDPARGTYRVGWVGVNASTKIARADLADFLLKQVPDNQFVRQMPFVSY
jgi:putative NADH-flavin reductase